MEPKNRFAPFVLGTSLILLAGLGIYIANRTSQYEIIVKGILGVFVLYLLFFYIRYSKIDASMESMLSDPKIYKYLIYALIGPGIAYLATEGIFDMLSWLIKNWQGL